MKNIQYTFARQKVLNEQRQLIKGLGFVPTCPYCWRDHGLYSRPAEGHHFLVKKGDVQRWELENRELINVPDNIIMLCHDCHELFGQTTHFTKWCVDYKQSLGYDLKAWLETLPFKITTDRTAYVR